MLDRKRAVVWNTNWITRRGQLRIILSINCDYFSVKRPYVLYIDFIALSAAAAASVARKRASC